MRNDVLLAEGLTEFLSTSFQRSLANPYSRTITFQAQDPTEARLRGALVRSELLADWHDIRRARRLFGRYLVLSKLGTQGGVPAAALELMRRAGDGDGLKAAARTIAIVGSPAPLRAATGSLLARKDLGASEAVASMRLLEPGLICFHPRKPTCPRAGSWPIPRSSRLDGTRRLTRSRLSSPAQQPESSRKPPALSAG